MEKLSVDRLRPGIFVSLTGIRWLNHPFLLNAFVLTNRKQIDALKAMGLKEIAWDPGRSLADPLPPRAPAEEEPDFGAAALAGMLDEKKSRIERVRALRENYARREREYEQETATAGEILKSLSGHPNEARAQATALVGRVVGTLQNAESVAIQLVSSKIKEPGLAVHSLNVMMLSLLLGKVLALSEDEMKLLGLGALLHDAGKSEVPLRILRSATRTPPEEDFYRAHVGYGIKVVAAMRDLPTAVRNVIACHHEHADGSGYPNRLPGEKIPKLARIVAIANRYDNLCNPFELAQSKTPAEALARLFRQEAAHYDPPLLQAFVKALGVFPPGSFVELSNGSAGLVVEHYAQDSLHPRVMLYDAEVPRSEALLVDLADAGLEVKQVVNPATLPVETVEYLAPRGRIDYYVEGER